MRALILWCIAVVLLFVVQLAEATDTRITTHAAVCGDLWSIHDTGLALREKAAGDVHGIDIADRMVDSANGHMLRFECPRRKKANAQRSQAAFKSIVLAAPPSLVADMLEDLGKKLDKDINAWREALASE